MSHGCSSSSSAHGCWARPCLHAKNLSVLLAGSSARLAPAYDIASALPYYHRRELKLALKIDSHYHVHKIAGRHWRRLADAVGIDGHAVLRRIRSLVDAVPDAFEEAVATTPDTGAGEDLVFITGLGERLHDHLAACRRALDH